MSLKKKYLKSKPVCKVTFELPKEAAPTNASVSLVGDFNNWDSNATPLTHRKSGVYNVTVDVAIEQEYAFRYLINGDVWENDWQADNYVPSHIPGVENSVVIV